MTSYPPSDGGDQQRRPGDEGQSQGGSPQQPGPPDPYGQQPYPQPGQYGQQPYPQQYGQPGYPPPAGYPGGGGPPGYPPPGYQGGSLDPDDPLVATSFSQWFSKSFGVLGRSWKALLLIQVGAYAVPVVLGLLVALLAVVGTPPILLVVLGFIVLVVFVAALLIAQGASYYFVTQEAAGAPVPVGDAVRFGASRALPLLGWGILAAILIFIGFILLVIPGIYLGVVLSVVAAVVMYERDGIGRCFSLVNPRWFPTFGRLLLFTVAGAVYQTIVLQILTLLLGPADTNPWVNPLLQLLSIPVALLAVGVTVVTYAELRHHEAPGQVSTARLSAELAQR
ncbi:hypothetical protein [Pseudonocardia sp. KRD291]|uniref:hypothetical protein n=1 Tax=Pseudonocardia sp. KRD291 TaxID=2792007 RepID=UPI001C49F5F2|nr:hypothetical protein [Pseudonocardia sp. KRD291]MBW0105726.1 hypothetical protein [Pseudonocardia sp. KRD291]